MEGIEWLLMAVVCFLFVFYYNMWLFTRNKSDKSELNKRDVSGAISNLGKVPPNPMQGFSLVKQMEGQLSGVPEIDLEYRRRLLMQDGDLAGLLELENAKCEKAMKNLKKRLKRVIVKRMRKK